MKKRPYMLDDLFYCAVCEKYHPRDMLGEVKKYYKKCKLCLEKQKRIG